jgi:hypothetical protein
MSQSPSKNDSEKCPTCLVGYYGYPTAGVATSPPQGIHLRAWRPLSLSLQCSNSRHLRRIPLMGSRHPRRYFSEEIKRLLRTNAQHEAGGSSLRSR